MTKLRFIGGLLCVFYVVVACGFGLIHDHQSQEHCSACAWAVNAVTDVATPVVVPVLAQVETDVATPSQPVIIAPVLCNTGSRAPPLASA